MQDIEQIRERIVELCESGAEIHVSVSSKRPKICVEDAPARICGAYKNLFRLETVEQGLKKSYTVQYTDLFIGKVKIRELDTSETNEI